MYQELKMAIDAVKTVHDIAKASNEMQRHSELLSAVTTVQDQLQAALLANLSLLEKQSELQARLAAAEEAAQRTASVEEIRRRYTLKEVYRGMVLEPRDFPENGEAPRYLCVTCMDKGVVGTLQPMGNAFHCHPCNVTLLRIQSPPKPRREPTRSFVRDW